MSPSKSSVSSASTSDSLLSFSTCLGTAGTKTWKEPQNEEHKSRDQVTRRDKRELNEEAAAAEEGTPKHRASILRLDARCDEKRQQRRVLNHSEWHGRTSFDFSHTLVLALTLALASRSTYRMCKQPSDTFVSWADTECQRYSHQQPGCIAFVHGKFASQSPWQTMPGMLSRADSTVH